MKRIFSKEKSRKEKKADFYILYTIVFAAISLFIYSCFYFNGKSLIWSHDGVPQHINALAYYGKYLRIFGNLLSAYITGGHNDEEDFIFIRSSGMSCGNAAYGLCG